mmetsp:Transcript_4515/g.3727  ORF Transcript_4515/g.3727 Transcript_4515/m.3727 type:complete len:214 (+) Transcript_4515:962-1603(+)
MMMDDEEIMNTYISMVGAGMDTTGHLITMVIYNLLKHPEYFEELKKERDEIYNGSTVDMDMLKKMDNLHLFIKETLRCHAPVPAPFPMEAIKDHKIAGFTVKKGTIIRPDYFFNHFNEKYFKDPYTFNPKRWLNRDSDDPFCFTPFSAGPRNCIGQHLSIIEAKIILSEFLKRYNFTCSDKNYNPKFTMRMLYEPDPALLLDIIPRGKPNAHN